MKALSLERSSNKGKRSLQLYVSVTKTNTRNSSSHSSFSLANGSCDRELKDFGDCLEFGYGANLKADALAKTNESQFLLMILI